MGSLTNNGTKIEDSDVSDAEISSSVSYDAPNSDERNERTSRDGASIALPAHVAGSGALNRLIETARDYAEASSAVNTNKAYAADWKHFTRWCRLKGTEPLPPLPEMIGLYVADLAAPTGKAPALLVSTIERRLSGLAWNYRQRGFTLDRKDRHIATVLAGIKRKHARPPVQKEAILSENIQVNRPGFAGDSKPDKDESHDKEQYGKSLFAGGPRPRGPDGAGTSRFL